MHYKYLVVQINPIELEKELFAMGFKGWKLIQIIPLQSIEPGIQINNQPRIKVMYQLIFIKPSDHAETTPNNE